MEIRGGVGLQAPEISLAAGSPGLSGLLCVDCLNVVIKPVLELVLLGLAAP